MNYESAQRTEESFSDPGDTPALNESTSSETSGGADKTAAGVLGPDNIAVPSASAPNAGSFNSESSTRNNAVNKVTESRTIPAGSLNRQTVSVALNAKVASKLDIDKVTDLVSAAAGINTERGDTATVKVVSFNDAGAAEATAALNASKQAAAEQQFNDLLRTGITTAGIVLVVVLGLIFYARRSRRQDREPVDIGALDEAVAPRLSASLPPIPPMPAPFELTPSQPNSERVDIDRKRADIDALAAADPQRTAQFLRGLMDDRQPA
jgi:flagellar M-ring protein FliF